MQANDMVAYYDDRDEHEIRVMNKAFQEHRRTRTFLTIEDVNKGTIIKTDGNLSSMLNAYLTWAKMFIEGTKKEGEPFEFRLTLTQSDGTIIRTSTMKRD